MFREYNQRQIAWQDYRNRKFQELSDAGDRASRHMGKPDPTVAEEIRARSAEYERLVGIDTRLKKARSAQNLPEYIKALEDAEQEMK